MKMPKIKDEALAIVTNALWLIVAFQVGILSQVPKVRDAGEQAFKIGHSVGADRCLIRRDLVPGYLDQDLRIALEHPQNRRR